MNLDTFRSYCLQKEGVTETFPFDEVTLVYKVYGKMFVLTQIENFERINVKCDPQKAIHLREQYVDQIIPGWHMNKEHWNTIYLAGFRANQLKEWIDHSYELVLSTIPRSKRKATA